MAWNDAVTGIISHWNDCQCKVERFIKAYHRYCKLEAVPEHMKPPNQS